MTTRRMPGGEAPSCSESGDCFNTGCMNHSRQPRQQLDMGQHEFNANMLVQSFVRMRRPEEYSTVPLEVDIYHWLYNSRCSFQRLIF